ncbi:hypothetical protein N7494_007143 [Penicillium frequentans]|uniref:Uncharacterized protein n=1 Tax=Penicillium frequentans TaxID=3151616 RepID=A0AAD6CRX0_9EURO|nr:hypothetical protein N7494_007143 [Penicillium glabrum]
MDIGSVGTCREIANIMVNAIRNKLQGHNNYLSWVRDVQWACSPEPHLWDVLTGVYKPAFQATMEEPALEQAKRMIGELRNQEMGKRENARLPSVSKADAKAWIQEHYTDPNTEYANWKRTCSLLSHVIKNSIAMHPLAYISHCDSAPAMWTALNEVFGKPMDSDPAKRSFMQNYNTWMGIIFKPGMTPSDFVLRWQAAYSECVRMKNGFEAAGISESLAFTVFMNAVSNNPATESWSRNYNFNLGDTGVIERVIPDFLNDQCLSKSSAPSERRAHT